MLARRIELLAEVYSYRHAMHGAALQFNEGHNYWLLALNYTFWWSKLWPFMFCRNLEMLKYCLSLELSANSFNLQIALIWNSWIIWVSSDLRDCLTCGKQECSRLSDSIFCIRRLPTSWGFRLAGGKNGKAVQGGRGCFLHMRNCSPFLVAACPGEMGEVSQGSQGQGQHSSQRWGSIFSLCLPASANVASTMMAKGWSSCKGNDKQLCSSSENSASPIVWMGSREGPSRAQVPLFKLKLSKLNLFEVILQRSAGIACRHKSVPSIYDVLLACSIKMHAESSTCSAKVQLSKSHVMDHVYTYAEYLSVCRPSSPLRSTLLMWASCSIPGLLRKTWRKLVAAFVTWKSFSRSWKNAAHLNSWRYCVICEFLIQVSAVLSSMHSAGSKKTIYIWSFPASHQHLLYT